MTRLNIWVIDHRDNDHQLDGKIINMWKLDPDEPPGPEYADFCALYTYWGWMNAVGDPPEFVGFFGYRKYLAPILPDWSKPAHAPSWYQCSKEYFDEYREFMAGWDGASIKKALAQYDILQAAPFPVDDLVDDFRRSRSQLDAERLGDATGWKLSHKIYPYLFITRWSVFDRMMREIDPIRKQLHGCCTGADSNNDEYKKRPMAYVMERVYSLWLENSGLSIHEMPLLHCWEMNA